MNNKKSFFKDAPPSTYFPSKGKIPADMLGDNQKKKKGATEKTEEQLMAETMRAMKEQLGIGKVGRPRTAHLKAEVKKTLKKKNPNYHREKIPEILKVGRIAWFSVSFIAREFKIAQSTVRKYINEGLMKGQKIGRGFYVPKYNLLEFMKVPEDRMGQYFFIGESDAVDIVDAGIIKSYTHSLDESGVKHKAS